MQLTPGQSLALLVLAGFGISGWLYGLHWKRVATGDAFTPDEKSTVRLQDQIRILSERNDELHAKLKKLRAEASGEETTSAARPDPGATLTTPPQLPTDPGAPGNPVLPSLGGGESGDTASKSDE